MIAEQITIAGIGLLGGSLGLALRKCGAARRVKGLARREQTVREAKAAGVADFATTDPAEAARGADLVVLCAPIGAMPELLRRMLPHLSRNAVVTDVGSAKRRLAAELEPICAEAGIAFVGAHPMAGSEQTGVGCARADLFDGALCALTPTPRTSPQALAQVEKLWQAVGARTVRLSPEEHDRIVSRTSHLPHFAAATLARHVLGNDRPARWNSFCGPGFADTTRIASGSPLMWREIAWANREFLIQELRAYAGKLLDAAEKIECGDWETVAGFLETAKALRDRWLVERKEPP